MTHYLPMTIPIIPLVYFPQKYIFIDLYSQIYMYIYIYIHKHIHTYIYIYIRTSIDTHVYLYIVFALTSLKSFFGSRIRRMTRICWALLDCWKRRWNGFGFRKCGENAEEIERSTESTVSTIAFNSFQ
jgi:hypothetical protein